MQGKRKGCDIMRRKDKLTEDEKKKLKEEYPELTDEKLEEVCGGDVIDFRMLRQLLEIIFRPVEGLTDREKEQE